jgi:hypothetical protein
MTCIEITCKKHGLVQAYVDIDRNAWCPICRDDMIREWLKDPENRVEMAQHMDTGLGPNPMSAAMQTDD